MISDTARGLQSFVDTAEYRVFADPNSGRRPADGAKEGLEQRLQDVLVLSRILRNDEHVHD